MAVTQQRRAVIKNAFLVTARGRSLTKDDVNRDQIFKVSNATSPADAQGQFEADYGNDYTVRSVERFVRLKDAA